MLKEMLDTLQKLPQRKALKSLDIDVSKPLIAIVTVSSEDSLANNEISVIVEKVKDGLSQSGAVSKVINCASREFSTAFGTQISKYELPMREYYANSVEFVCASDIYDGIVFVVSQPMAAAGLLIGAVRMNMPCMFVSQGVMSPIEFEGQHTGYLSMYTEIGELKTGRINHEKMELIENSLPLSLGTDCETYGENSFNCVLEVMGLSIKNNGSAPAHTVERYKIARATGNAIVEMIKNKLTLKTLLTSQVLLTATATDLAIGGSATTLLNMLALSKELGLKNLTMDTIEELAKNTPVLVDCSDSALSFMEQFHSAGATYAVLRELEKNQIIRCDYTIFNGKSMSSTLKGTVITENKIIRSMISPAYPTSYLRVMRGNLADDGAIAQFHNKITSFNGTAKIYTNEESAVDAILGREISAGDVMVIRNEGAKSGPGMRQIYISLALLKAVGLEKKVAVITDGRIPDFYGGIVVGHITPESYDMGTISILRDGDNIDISINKGRISVDIKANEKQNRLKTADIFSQGSASKYLRAYAKTVGSPSEGCVIK